MNDKSRFSRAVSLFFTSPYFLLLFLLIPAYSVISLKLRLSVSGDLLLGNNMVFCTCVAARIIWRVLKMRGGIRYGADCSPPRKAVEIDRPISVLQNDLTGAGFGFENSGHYAEKRDLGYLGGTILYAGLLLLLLVGSYDYLREYSIMVRIGVGEPMSLDNKGLLGQFEAGFLAGTNKLPQLQVRKQILPNPEWPKGATEIALLSEDRKELAKGTVSPDKTFRYKGLDFSMTRYIFDALIVIRSGNYLVYEGFVKFFPLPQKKGEFSYYCSLKTDKNGNVEGAAWLNPADKKKVRIDATLSGKKIIDTELELWGVNQKTVGDYTAKLEGLAQWSEIQVARSRHTLALEFGALLALIGGFMRIAVRPQRVWLEEVEQGSRVRAVGREAKKLLKSS